MMYISQTIMLYILNLYSAVYQLYFHKTRKEKKKIYLFFTFHKKKKKEDQWLKT